MVRWARFARVVLILNLVVLGGDLVGCAGGNPLTGRRIVADLERAHIATPDETGRAHAPDPRTRLPRSGPITLADLLGVAESENPDLASARSEVGVAAGRAWQASLYPNPRLDVSVEDVSWRDGFSGAKTTVGATQPIILGDRRKAAMRAASAEQAARLAEVDARRRALFGEVASLHAALLAIREQESLYRELRRLADETLGAAQSRFEARAAPETDVIRPRVELYRIDAALGRLAQERRVAARRLSLLIGDVEIDVSRLDGAVPMAPPSLDAARLEAETRVGHPSLLAADREIEAAEARLARVKAENVPDLDVRVAAGYRGDSDDGIVEFGAGMSVPLWDQRQGAALSARFSVMRARQHRASIEIDLLGRLAEAIGAYEGARTQLGTLRERIVPDAQRAFELTSEGYRAGRGSFLDLLDAQRTFTEARVTLSELAAAATAARARVIQIVGPEGLDHQDEAPGASSAQAQSITHVRRNGAEEIP